MFGTSRVPPNPQALAAVTANGAEPPLHFNLVIRKAAGTDLGIDVAYSSASESSWTRNGIFIARVFEDGAVAAWNDRSAEPRRVRPGDFIFQVNNIHSDTISMIQEIKVKQMLTIHVLRVQNLEVLGHDFLQEFNGIINPPDSSESEGHISRPQSDEEDVHLANNRPRNSSRVEALLAQFETLGDEALVTLLTAVLQRRPLQSSAIN